MPGMPRVGGAKSFWKVLRSLSLKEIEREATRPVNVHISGDPPAAREVARALAVDPDARLPVPADAGPALPAPDVAALLAAPGAKPDIVIHTGGPGRPDGAHVYAMDELGGLNAVLERMLDDRPDLLLPLARTFPAMRTLAARRIIAETSAANAQFALVTGVAEAVPLTAWLLPVNGLSDIVVLTKNQAIMVLRLAAAYGLELELKSRARELAPVVGSAFGLRAVARELVGAIPVVGFIVRATIAYAGTSTLGRAAQIYYQTGETVTAAQARRLYHDAYAGARSAVQRLAGAGRRLGRRKPKLLPPPTEGVTEPVD